MPHMLGTKTRYASRDIYSLMELQLLGLDWGMLIYTSAQFDRQFSYFDLLEGIYTPLSKT